MPVVCTLRGLPDLSVSALNQTERCARAAPSAVAGASVAPRARLEARAPRCASGSQATAASGDDLIPAIVRSGEFLWCRCAAVCWTLGVLRERSRPAHHRGRAHSGSGERPHAAGRSSLRLPLRKACRDLREVLQPRRALCQVPLEPPHRRLLVLRRSTVRVDRELRVDVLPRAT
jgi:hypothetical protein